MNGANELKRESGTDLDTVVRSRRTVLVGTLAPQIFDPILQRIVGLADQVDRGILATPEGIVLLKLFALPPLYRQGKTQSAALYECDIRQLLMHQPLETEHLLTQLPSTMPHSDLNALRQILTDIQQHINQRHRF